MHSQTTPYDAMCTEEFANVQDMTICHSLSLSLSNSRMDSFDEVAAETQILSQNKKNKSNEYLNESKTKMMMLLLPSQIHCATCVEANKLFFV